MSKKNKKKCCNDIKDKLNLFGLKERNENKGYQIKIKPKNFVNKEIIMIIDIKIFVLYQFNLFYL